MDAEIISLYTNKKGMSLKEENKKLKERIEALEFMKELQQDIIADPIAIGFEKVTGQELSNKYLPEALVKEIEKKKKRKKALQNKPDSYRVAIRMFRGVKTSLLSKN